MNDLLFATNNQHKIREIREIVGSGFRILGLGDIGLNLEIPETADTLEGNALQKARFIHEKTGMNCFADDTGLEINALGGKPGVYSARYAGEGCSFDDNIRKVLEEMAGMHDRSARFRCMVALIWEDQEHLFEGIVEGSITTDRKGCEGFGYDPVFLPVGDVQTFAEMPPYLKNGISHRGKAISKMIRFLVKKIPSGSGRD